MSTVHVAHRGRLIVLEWRDSRCWYFRPVVPPVGSPSGDGESEAAGPFESLDAAWDAARRHIDEVCDQQADGASCHRAPRPTPAASGTRELQLALQDAELAGVRPEDRRRMARHLAHRLANIVQLLSGRLYIEKEKGLGDCPIFRAAQDTVARMEGLLSAVHALGESNVARSAAEDGVGPGPAEVGTDAEAV